jgi:hypothetical protein
MMSSVKEEKLIDVLATKYAVEGLSASLKPFLFKIPVLEGAAAMVGEYSFCL